MGEGEEDVVVVHRVRAHAADLGIDRGDRSEQTHRLVDHVRAEVEQDPTAVGGGFLPRRHHLGPPTLEARLEPVHLAQGAGFDEFRHGEEVAVPTSVEVHREQQVGLIGVVDE